MLGPGVSEYVSKPFRRCFSVHYSPLGLMDKSPDVFQSKMFWGLLFLVQVLQVGMLDVGYECFVAQREFIAL